MRRLLRALLPAVFLAVLQAPLALGQMEQPELYAYHDLIQYGGGVFAFVGTDIAYPPYFNHCDFGCNNNCWDAYTSYAETDLYWDGFWVGGDSGALWDTGVSAYMQVDAWPGVWTLEATHFVEDLYYRDAYGFQWHEPWMPDHQWENLTVNPEISISSDQYVDDSETPTAYFYVSPQGGTPTWYAWDFTVGAPGGNNPYVNFTDPYDDVTFTDAHWYAYPNDPCSASAISPYLVTATVGFGDIQRTASAGLAVSVPWMPAGTTARPTVDGTWTAGHVGDVYFVLTTNLYRTQPQVNIFVPSTSQFRNKVDAHEQVHVDQWGPGGMFANRFKPDDLRSAIINLTDSTYEGLLDKVTQATNAYMGLQMILLEAMWLDAELEAHYVSDPINPQYLYQVCPY